MTLFKKINSNHLNDDEYFTCVYANYIHFNLYLSIKKPFSTWIKEVINKYDLKENFDFFNGKPSLDDDIKVFLTFGVIIKICNELPCDEKAKEIIDILNEYKKSHKYLKYVYEIPNNRIKLSLPVYTVPKKLRFNLITINWYRNAHYQISHEMKKQYLSLISEELKDLGTRINGKYKVTYIYHYKNKNSDLMNVVSIIDKFFLDALQELEIVQEDNVKHCVEVVARVGQQDKENPRVEIIVESV